VRFLRSASLKLCSSMTFLLLPSSSFQSLHNIKS
jgi:hypothetical protein